MRIRDGSSDVCSSDLRGGGQPPRRREFPRLRRARAGGRRAVADAGIGDLSGGWVESGPILFSPSGDGGGPREAWWRGRCAGHAISPPPPPSAASKRVACLSSTLPALRVGRNFGSCFRGNGLD